MTADTKDKPTLEATEYGRQYITTKEWRDSLVDFVVIQRGHGTTDEDLTNSMRLLTAVELSKPARGRLPHWKGSNELRAFIDANREIIDSLLFGILDEGTR